MSNLSDDPFARSNCLVKHVRDYRGQLQYERDKFFKRLHRHKINATCWTLAILANVLLTVTLVVSVQAQTVPKSLEQGGTSTALKERKNAWTVGLAGGQLSGTYMTFADELAQVLDDGDNLRVLPIVTHGAASNLDDLLYLRNIDLVMTQSDIFEYFRTQRKTPDLEKKIHYIIRLPVSEMHVLATADIKTIGDLRGKKVSFGPAGSASSLTGTIVFQRLGIKVEQVLTDNPTALRMLKGGELAALVRVIGKPVDFFARIPPDSGLHLVPIPFSRIFTDQYTVGEFTSEEYPTLVPQGEKIDTIAVPAVLAVYNWPKDTDRYRRVQKFTEALFSKWDKFTEAQRHPKWRDVSLTATVPGWTRWSVAEEMLRRIQQRDPTVAELGSFLNFQSPPLEELTQEQRKAVAGEFLRWQKLWNSVQQQGNVRQQGSMQEQGNPVQQQGTVQSQRTTVKASTVQQQPDREHIAELVKQGKAFIASGDFAAARVVLQRAAESRDAEAALALAATYDPVILRQLKVYGFAADVDTARTWYERATEFGSPEAPRRLEMLTKTKP
jgi:TRAP-type uncharacterized transport system substrate-binding protein